MKKTLLSVVFTLLLSHLAVSMVRGQDLIIKLNGDELTAHVLEIGIQNILYKLPDQPETDTLRIPRQEVFMIRFANGTREVFTESLPENRVVEAPSQMTPEQLYLKGQNDAHMLYRPRGILAASAGLTFTAFFTYGLGLAGPIAIGAPPPKPHNFTVSDPSLLNSPDYVTGYKKRAHKRKIGRTAGGVVVGALTGAAAVVAVVIIAFSNWQ